MEHAPCPISGTRNFIPYLTVPDRFDPSGKTWHLVRSGDSGLIMLDPRPSAGKSLLFYPERAYDPHLHETVSAGAGDALYLLLRSVLMQKKARIVLDGISKSRTRTKVLEVGCSSGELLLRLHRGSGIPLHNLVGIETNRRVAAIARTKGLRVLETDLSETEFSCRFDRIVFWHTLEHLHRIGENLQRAAALLEPDGMLIIAVPNRDSYDAQHYGSRWIAWDAPRHLYHFNPSTLSALLSKYGFFPGKLQTYPPDSIYNVWHSEKLACMLDGHRFMGGRAVFHAARALLAGINAEKASGIVCFAVLSRQYLPERGTVLPSDFSNSTDATR
jgi:SAM-dependent methyltransferase